MSRLRLFAVLFCLSALLPTPSFAQSEQHQSNQITISRDSEFTKGNGVVSGKGTKKNPYVISKLSIWQLKIENTSKAVRIVDSTLGNLTLNFIGRNVEVRRNTIEDLRVNENVERTGQPTSGMFMNNKIGSVSQIRHFDGRFAYNKVGPSNEGTIWGAVRPVFSGSPQAVNFDGFNGARFDHNTVLGTVDVRIHGHHHGSSFSAPSHMHNDEAMPSSHGEGMMDHTKRYHEVVVSDNSITAIGSHALSYTDTGHAGNDRTAASETEEDLNLEHVHYTKVLFANNKLIGSGILVDVFNAEDKLHKKAPKGSMDLIGNSIELKPSEHPFFDRISAGINVANARYMTLRILRTTVTAPKQQESAVNQFWNDGGAGVSLDRIEYAKILIDDLRVNNRTFGVYASEMTSSVNWKIRRLRTDGVAQPVGRNRVENAPDYR